MGKRKVSAGDVFGLFTIIEAYARLGAKRHWYHLSRCVCGYEEYLTKGTLQKRMSKSCCHADIIKPGDRFGRFTILEPFLSSEDGRTKYKCRCDCGTIKIMVATYLKLGIIKSCGCLKREENSKVHSKHHLYGTHLYRAWRNIKNRCLDPNVDGYKYYGARGIGVCEAWLDFEPFMKWSYENGYKEGLSIDRINSKGNYCPENCQWIPILENVKKMHAERRAARLQRQEEPCLSRKE